MNNTSDEINLQSKQGIICHVAKMKPVTSAHYPGFIHFFVNRIQDFFQTFSRPFFLFSRLKITVKFFMAREEIIVLIMKTTNKKRKKTVSAV